MQANIPVMELNLHTSAFNIQHLPEARHRQLDLRNVEHFNNFGCHRLTFKLKINHPVDLTTHHNTPAQNVKLAKDILNLLLRDALSTSAQHGLSVHSVIHVYLHCRGLDTDFVFNPIGEGAKQLHHFLYDDASSIAEIVDKFAEIIQSNKPCFLDNKTRITVVGFEPPPNYIQPVQFIGSGWGQNNNTSGNAE